MCQESDMRALDLVIDGNDISHFVGPRVNCEETLAEWTVHTELIRNQETPGLLRPLNDKNVQVKYRMRSPAGVFPWRSGRAVVTWRLTEMGNEELILHGIGLLDKAKSQTNASGVPMTVTITKTTSVGGVVVEKEEDIGTISIVEEDPQQVAIREAQVQLAQETEIQAITSPSFILFLANSALSSYRSLRSTGMSENNGELLYSSFIFLPLAIEYFLKYLLVKNIGEFKDEYKTHKLLALFDFLPFEVQGSLDNEFENELEKIGRERTFQKLRVFLKKSQNAFTAIRYLFDPKNATTSRHLLRPENIAVLTCVSNALERVSKRI